MVYNYDANGNLLSQSGAGKAVAYTYDVYNRLIQYTEGSVKETYTYDAEGVRRSKVNGNDTIYYISDNTGSLSYTLAETDKDGNVIATYNRADVLISQVRDGVISYYLFDGHGDVRALINDAGRITDKYRYNAYGELIERSGETENHYLYTGEYYNGTSNLYYLRARYMSPSTGTFISMDTYEGSIYDLDTLHKYLYANGNPVKYNDPTGNYNMSIGQATIAMAGFAFLACIPKICYDFRQSIADAGIIPSRSYSLANSMLLSLAISGACTFLTVVSAIEGKIKAKIKGEIEIYEASAIDQVEEMDKNKEMYYVYFLKKKDGEDIEYVGRTKNLKSRITAHANSSNRSDLVLAGFIRTDNYFACRAIEQAAMLGAHTLKGSDGEVYNNQINGVGINNSNAVPYLDAAMSLWDATDKSVDYILNQVDNERLNQIEKILGNGLIDYESIY